MGGKSSPTVGYWYHPAFQMGLSYGPIDSFLEFRGGDVTAWSGTLTASGTITIDQPNLWGGPKNMGGIQGDVDICFGEPTQLPNAYMVSTFGDQVPAYRGFSTVVFKGGRYGAMNPYAQKASYKICKIIKGWDGDPGDGSACWYPAHAAVTVGSGTVYNNELDIAGTAAQPSLGTANYVLSGLQPTDPVYIEHIPGMASQAWSRWSSDTNPTVNADGAWCNQFYVTDDSGSTVEYWTPFFKDASEAEAYANANPALLYGSTSYSFWLQDDPVDDNRGGLSVRIRAGDPPLVAMNPAHILYYARTQQHMGREPAANMNAASFQAAADWYYSQNFGLCTTYDASQETVDAFVARIEKAAGCSMSRSPVDGTWYLDVANGVYDVSTLPVLTDDDILDFTDQPSTLDTAVNSVSVKYFDPHLKANVTTPPIQALALVNVFGTIHQETDYPEIPTAGLAGIVAQRDLAQTTTPTHALEITTTRVTYAWRRGTYFVLQAPRRGIASMVCILGDIQRGTLVSGAIKLTAAQDIYSLPTTCFVQQEAGAYKGSPTIPSAVVNQVVTEAPYIDVVPQLSPSDLAALDDTSAYLMAMAVDPAQSIDFTMQTSPHGAATWSAVGNGEWCPSALIVQGDALVNAAPATSFTLAAGNRLGNVALGSVALWGTEIVRVDAIDPVGLTLTIGRGCADTVAAPHAVGSRIYFYGTTPAHDPTQLTAGESLDVQLLTNTASMQLTPSLATTTTVTMVGRLSLPYPPGGLLIGGSPYPNTVSGDFTVTWNDRNRVTQADQLVDASMAAVTPASNTRYDLKFVDSNGNTLAEQNNIYPATAQVALNYTGNVTMTLAAIDDNGTSLQHHTVTFAYTPPSPVPASSTITAAAYTPVYDGIIYDGGAAGTGT